MKGVVTTPSEVGAEPSLSSITKLMATSQPSASWSRPQTTYCMLPQPSLRNIEIGTVLWVFGISIMRLLFEST